MDETAHLLGVKAIHDRLAGGELCQLNPCRVMSHPLTDDANLAALQTLVSQGNPAAYAGRVHGQAAGLEVFSASPEALLIARKWGAESRTIERTGAAMASTFAKDDIENDVIVDLVGYDRSSVCRPGEVSVVALSALEEVPGLTHPVTTVSATTATGGGNRRTSVRPLCFTLREGARL